jgi:hypothetical protein
VERKAVQDKLILAAYQTFLEEVVARYQTPYLVMRPEPSKPVPDKTLKGDHFDVLAEQQAKVIRAQRVVLAALGDLLAQT